MRRLNKFRLRPTREQERVLFSICEMSAVLWNKLNYIRRQAFFDGGFDWREGVDELYKEFKRILGSATTQQILRKNDEAWKSFLKLLRLKQQGKLPEHVRKISPPKYWKDRKTGKRKLMSVIRNDCYKIEEVRGKKYLVFPGVENQNNRLNQVEREAREGRDILRRFNGEVVRASIR